MIFGQHIPFSVMAQFTAHQVLKIPLFFTTHDVLGSMVSTKRSYSPGKNENGDFGFMMNIINTRIIPIISGAYSTISSSSKLRAVRSRYGLSTPYPIMEALSPYNAASIPTFLLRILPFGRI